MLDNENEIEESDQERKDPSNNYISTGRNEEHIELKAINNKVTSTFKPNHNESQEERDDNEESNSLKPSTKEEPKNPKKK